MSTTKDPKAWTRALNYEAAPSQPRKERHKSLKYRIANASRADGLPRFPINAISYIAAGSISPELREFRVYKLIL
jgi:hypothetical protein